MSRHLLRTIGTIVFGAIVAAGIALSFYILRRLRTQHRDKWTELGEPSFFLNMSVRNQRRLSKFIWSGEYRQLNDESLDKTIAACKFLTVLGFAAVLLCFGNFIAVVGD
ncbi:MAG: hypothetical protein ACREC3_04350 [Methyloceanibacter sp.]